MNEEERLRRAVARGAGEVEVRRLLAIIETKRAPGPKPRMTTFGLASASAPVSTSSTQPVGFGCDVVVDVVVDDPVAGPAFSVEYDVQLDPASSPVLVSLWAISSRMEGGPLMLHERFVERGGVYRSEWQFKPPVTFSLRWRQSMVRNRPALALERSLRVTYEVPEAPVALVRRVPAPGDESHWYRGEANGQGVAVTACGVPITREETTFSTRREPAPPWVTCPVCLAAWRRA